MSILLNVVAFVASMALLHFAVSIAWGALYRQFLTRQLLDKAILPESERAGLKDELHLIPLVVLGPSALALAILWFVPGGLAWVAGSWGVRVALALALIELALFAWSPDHADAARVAVYKENLEKIRKPLAAWQDKELEPYRRAWAIALVRSVEDIEDEEGDEPDEGEELTGDAGPPPAHLEFDILEVHGKQRIVDTEPWFAPGGDWTVLKCCSRTEPTATFWAAETSPDPSGDPPIAFGDGRIWANSPNDWDHLGRAVAAAFNPSKTAASMIAATGPISLATIIFSRSTARMAGGGFTAVGTWTATKWTTEDGSEFFFNWSAEEKLGHLSEKDEGYADGVCEAFGAQFEESAVAE